jgi:phosphoribosylanthranilate isomerase
MKIGNVAQAIATVQPFGVDVSSAVESRPGQKDAQLINTFVRAAKAAEKIL